MRTIITALAALLLAGACGGGGTESTAPASPAPPTAAGPTASEVLALELKGLTLDEFYFESFEALITRSPETVVWQALSSVFPLDDVGLDDLSEDYRRETFAMHQVVLDALLGYDRSVLTADDQLTYDIYRWHLQDVADRLEFYFYDFPATFSLFGKQRDTEQLMTDLHPLATRQDADDYITRLRAVLRKFSQLADHLNKQRNAGVVEPALTMRAAKFAADQIADGPVDTNPYFTSFRDKLNNIPGLSDADRQTFLNLARQATTTSVIPAYQQLRGTLQNLLSARLTFDRCRPVSARD